MVANPNPNRPPLLPADTYRERKLNNGSFTNPNRNPNRSKSKPVSSRYLLSPATSSSSTSSSSTSSSSFSTPRRCPSPIASRTEPIHTYTKPRSVSADRSRVDAAGKMTATRSLSVSFQGEAFSLPVSKKNPVEVTPRYRPDQHRWPARIRQVNNLNGGNLLLNNRFDRNLDDEKHNVVGSDSDKLGSDLNRKLDIELNGQMGNEQNGKLGNEFNGKMYNEQNGKLGNDLNDSSEILRSMRQYTDVVSKETDSDSVSSSSSNSGRTVISAKYWQEPCIRTPLPKCSSKMVVPPKFGQPKKFPMEMASPRAMSSPMRGSVRTSSPMRSFSRPSSPSRVNGSVESRGMPSPSRVRSSISSGFSETPSVLSYAVDVKRGKVRENQIMDAHTLRILYNRQLQWRFVNARKEAVLLEQRRSVQKNLLDAWKTISNLRESVTRKTHRLHLMKQKLKLACILKDQIIYLEEWASLDKGQCMSLLGSIEALKGSTLRLLVVDGAITDLQNIKDAIGSAVDVMQAMGSSICSFFSKVEEMSSLASELTKEISKEQALLEQCKVDFTKLAAQQVEYCSLKTHILQDYCTYN